MVIPYCALLPHPPILVPAVGGRETGKIADTLAAVRRVAQEIVAAQPETVVLMTPHGPVFRDAISIISRKRMAGDLAQFGHPEVSLTFETDMPLINEILSEAQHQGIRIVGIDERVADRLSIPLELDHGAVVPLSFIRDAGYQGKIIHLSVGMVPYEEMYAAGSAVRRAAAALGRRVAVVASGDLSHRLLPHAPAGYSPNGKIFDAKVLEILRQRDVAALRNLKELLISEAGECGLRPIHFLFGVLDDAQCQGEIRSYEGPFGVGYAVVSFRCDHAREVENRE